MDETVITEETIVLLRKEQDKLVKLIEALAKLDKSKEWGALKELVFDTSLQAIERQLLSSALVKDININTLYRLQGEWAWAKQYSDMNRFVETLKKQLEEIKKRLQ